MAVLHELEQAAFAHDGVGEVESGKFDLLRVAGHTDLVEDPIVERAVDFEFQRADGVGDAFDGIRDAVGEVIHRVDAPLVAGPVMVEAFDAIDDRIAHVQVGGGHVDLGA